MLRPFQSIAGAGTGRPWSATRWIERARRAGASERSCRPPTTACSCTSTWDTGQSPWSACTRRIDGLFNRQQHGIALPVEHAYTDLAGPAAGQLIADLEADRRYADTAGRHAGVQRLDRAVGRQ